MPTNKCIVLADVHVHVSLQAPLFSVLQEYMIVLRNKSLLLSYEYKMCIGTCNFYAWHMRDACDQRVYSTIGPNLLVMYNVNVLSTYWVVTFFFSKTSRDSHVAEPSRETNIGASLSCCQKSRYCVDLYMYFTCTRRWWKTAQGGGGGGLCFVEKFTVGLQINVIVFIWHNFGKLKIIQTSDEVQGVWKLTKCTSACARKFLVPGDLESYFEVHVHVLVIY